MTETKLDACKRQNDSECHIQVQKMFCQPCSNKGKTSSAAIFCSTCDEYQCTECWSVHKFYNIMKDHSVLDVKVALEKLDDLHGLERCEIHDKCIEYFCNDHEILCCSACAISDHRHCNSLEDIEDLTTVNYSLQHQKTSLLEEKEKCTTISKHFTDNERRVQDRLHKISEKLTSLQVFISKQLNEQELRITSESESLLKEKIMEYRQRRSDVEDIIVKLEKNLEMLDIATRTGSQEQIFILQQRFEESFDNLNEKAKHIFSQLKNTEVSLEVDKKLETLIETGYLGTLETERHFGSAVKFEKIVSIDLPHDGDDIEEPLYTGMDFLPDGRLVAVDNYNNKCLIFDEKLELLTSIEVSQYPHGVVTVSEDEVAITFGGEMKVELLQISKTNEITTVKTVKTKSQYHSICLMDDERFVVGLIDGAQPVCILSISGKEESLKVHFPENSADSYICTYTKNIHKIVLADWNENIVYIIDAETDTLIAVKDEEIKVPKGLAVGPLDTIFVCSSYTHSLVHISPGGHLLSSYKLDMKFPFRICISNDKTKIAVVNNVAGNRILQLLQIDIC